MSVCFNNMHWFRFLHGVWSPGASVSPCSPWGRVSSVLSTCRLSRGCLQVGWTASGRNGGAHSAALLSRARPLQVSGTRKSQQLEPHWYFLGKASLSFCCIFFPCICSSCSVRLLCVTRWWKQYQPGVLFNGHWGLYEGYALVCACTLIYTLIWKEIHAMFILMFAKIWAGTTGWSIPAASPSFSVHCATPKPAALCKVHQPTPACRMQTHR